MKKIRAKHQRALSFVFLLIFFLVALPTSFSYADSEKPVDIYSYNVHNVGRNYCTMAKHVSFTRTELSNMKSTSELRTAINQRSDVILTYSAYAGNHGLITRVNDIMIDRAVLENILGQVKGTDHHITRADLHIDPEKYDADLEERLLTLTIRVSVTGTVTTEPTTDPTEPTETNPTDPTGTDPTDPTETNPTDPTETGSTGTNPTDPTETGSTGTVPTEPDPIAPTDPTGTDPTAPPTDPTGSTGTAPTTGHMVPTTRSDETSHSKHSTKSNAPQNSEPGEIRTFIDSVETDLISQDVPEDTSKKSSTPPDDETLTGDIPTPMPENEYPIGKENYESFFDTSHVLVLVGSGFVAAGFIFSIGSDINCIRRINRKR